MISFSQTWHRLIKPLRKRKSFQINNNHGLTKSVRFYGIDQVFYTHSSIDYDRTPVAELTEDDFYYYDDDEDDEEYEYEEYDKEIYEHPYYSNIDEENDDEEEEDDLPVTPSMTTQFDYYSRIEPSLPMNHLLLNSNDHTMSTTKTNDTTTLSYDKPLFPRN
ncbi:hypothetical protein BJ944DRAFT_249588 [Cunninghamella echinulata]|nr:hypothetical protein BJ944DRAFT_249588 [Cunninghamella echinulata]